MFKQMYYYMAGECAPLIKYIAEVLKAKQMGVEGTGPVVRTRGGHMCLLSIPSKEMTEGDVEGIISSVEKEFAQKGLLVERFYAGEFCDDDYLEVTGRFDTNRSRTVEISITRKPKSVYPYLAHVPL